MALTKIDDRGLKTPIDLLDNEKIRLGTGNDLEIYHDGSHSWIRDTGTGRLIIDGSELSFNKTGNTDYYCRMIADGAVELYHDNVKTFETQANGIIVLGPEGGDAEVRLKADEGDDYEDLWRVLAATDGSFHIQNIASGSWEHTIKAVGNGAVELYYDHSKKLETYTGGVEIVGDCFLEDNNKLKIGSSGDLEIWHDGSTSLIKSAGHPLAYYADTRHHFLNGDGSENVAVFTIDGSCDLYHDNVKTLSTNSNGIIVQGPEGGHGEIYLYADEGDDNADKYLFQSGTDGAFYIKNYTSGSWEVNLKTTGNGNVELYYDNVLKLETLTDGLRTKDDQKFCWGDGFDLQIYHNGTDSKIINSTGNLTINATATEPGINIAPNGSVDLYHNNIKTFETTSTGTKTTGINLITGDVAASYIAQIFHDGANTNRYGLTIQCGADDSAGTNYAIGIHDGNGDGMGFITFTSGTVTYGAFTAHHPCIVPDSENPSDSSNAYPYGTLLETISIEYTQKNGSDTERGIRYKVQKTQSANSRKVLGAYGSSMNGGPDGQTNEHQALILGDGHILVNNAGGNIEVGDGICSSATAGIGQKATANPSMIIGIAQEAVTFTGSETKLVAVQYGLQQFIPWT